MSIDVYEVAEQEWATVEGTQNLLDLWERSEHKLEMERLVGAMVANRLRHETLVDLGCGPGRLIPHLPKFRTYRGYDTCERFLEVARELYGADKRCAFILRSLFDGAPYKSPPDVLICIGVAQHYHDPVGLLRVIAERWPARATMVSMLYGPEAQELLNTQVITLEACEQGLALLGTVVEAHDVAIPRFEPLVTRYAMVARGGGT